MNEYVRTNSPSRRGLLSAAGMIGVIATGGGAVANPASATDEAWFQVALARYAGFGDKASGGPGDLASCDWLQQDLARLGFACSRQRFNAPYFDVRAASLSCGDAKADVIPQAMVIATGPGGVTGRLRKMDAADLTGAIAVVVLPYRRWVSLGDPQVSKPLTDAFERGAAAAVLITTGPTSEAIALNVSTHRKAFDRPVVILAPNAAAPFLAKAAEGAEATLMVDGSGGQREAFNLIARLDRDAAKTLIVTTPRSGWFGCAAERGSGLVVWLDLARRLAGDLRTVNLEFACTSGHEYEYLGGEHYLEHRAPPPAQARLWVHIGASAAARDWHELGPVLRPLPSADSQRVLTASPTIQTTVRDAFRGISGLEAVYPADEKNAGGELVNVLKAGYPELIGLYGGHRYFHTRGDDLRCVSSDLVRPVAEAFHQAILGVLA